MQIPTPDMGSERLELLGRFHLAALRRGGADLADLASAFEPALTALIGAAAARIEAERALIDPRVGLRFAEREVEGELRALLASAEALDRRRGGPAATALFPAGLLAETRPRSQGQADALRRVHNRLATSALAEPLRAEFLARLTQAALTLDAALAARKSAAEALGLAMAGELATRDDFCRAYDGSAGSLRQRFPRDRELQDLYFDTIRSAHRRDPDEDEGSAAPAAS